MQQLNISITNQLFYDQPQDTTNKPVPARGSFALGTQIISKATRSAMSNSKHISAIHDAHCPLLPSFPFGHNKCIIWWWLGESVHSFRSRFHVEYGRARDYSSTIAKCNSGQYFTCAVQVLFIHWVDYKLYHRRWSVRLSEECGFVVIRCFSNVLKIMLCTMLVLQLCVW